MHVVNITAAIAARNPAHAQNLVAERLQGIDEAVTMLSLAADSAALAEADESLVRGLALIHARLRRECDSLFQLL